MATQPQPQWRWLAALCGVFNIIGLIAMLAGAITNRADGKSWAIFAATAIGTFILGTIFSAVISNLA